MMMGRLGKQELKGLLDYSLVGAPFTTGGNTDTSIICLQSKISIQCLSNINHAVRVVTLHWYNGKHGHIHREAPTLAICYDIGRLQIMKDESDESKLVLN